jgi:hypothetical protein
MFDLKSLPETPPAKIPFQSTDGVQTIELIILRKILAGTLLNESEETTLVELLDFYRELFHSLKKQNLSLLIDKEAHQLIRFVKDNINLIVAPSSPHIDVDKVYRVTAVRKDFLEDNRVRDLKYLKHRSKEQVAKDGFFGRANTSSSTVFYCSISPDVAIFETKPQINDSIIIAEWRKIDKDPFILSPVISNKLYDNDLLGKTRIAYEKLKNQYHPSFSKIMDLYFDFFSSEILKEIKEGPNISEKRFEYLFSAVFTELVLEQTLKWKNTAPKVDGLIYPSIACHHNLENIAFTPEATNKLYPYKLIQGIVSETNYDMGVSQNGELPITLADVRTAKAFSGNRIIWDDNL